MRPIPFILVFSLLPLSAQSPDEEMARLRDADQAVRQGPMPTEKERILELQAQELQRRDRARALLREDRLKDAHSYGAAALIFQHGDSLDDFLVARELALLACFRKATYGNMPFLAEDRFLTRLGRPQRFGSQYLNQHTRDQEPIEEKGANVVTDALRLDAFLPPLRVSRAGTPEQANAEASSAIMARIRGRMKADAKGPEWITDPARSPAAPVLASLDAKGDPASLRARLFDLYRRDQFFIPGDYHRAAELLLAVAQGSSDLLLANEWAALAVMRLYGPAWRTFAHSWDRYAQSIGQPSRYGTLPGSAQVPSIPPAVVRAMRAEGL